VVDGPQGTTEVDARPSDALALALVVGAPVRADRAVVDTTESSAGLAQTLAAIDSQEATGPQALIEELAAEAQRQDPPEPSS
jgi:bifunctional DNase/RNase